MFQKGSYTVPSDSSGVLRVKVIQTRRCSVRRHAKICKFLRVVLKKVKPFLVRKRKRKRRAITIRTKHSVSRNDGFTYKFQDNAVILLKRRMNTMGKDLYGSVSKELKIRKFRVAFKKIF